MTDPLLLNSFERESDGLWRCVRVVTLGTAARPVRVEIGMLFSLGLTYKGLNIAGELESAAARLPYAHPGSY